MKNQKAQNFLHEDICMSRNPVETCDMGSLWDVNVLQGTEIQKDMSTYRRRINGQSQTRSMRAKGNQCCSFEHVALSLLFMVPNLKPQDGVAKWSYQRPIVPIGWAVAPSLLVRVGEARHFLFWSVYSSSPVWYECSVQRIKKVFSTSLNMLSISHAEEASVRRHEVQWVIYWRKDSSSCLFRYWTNCGDFHQSQTSSLCSFCF